MATHDRMPRMIAIAEALGITVLLGSTLVLVKAAGTFFLGKVPARIQYAGLAVAAILGIAIAERGRH